MMNLRLVRINRELFSITSPEVAFISGEGYSTRFLWKETDLLLIGR